MGQVVIGVFSWDSDLFWRLTVNDGHKAMVHSHCFYPWNTKVKVKQLPNICSTRRSMTPFHGRASKSRRSETKTSAPHRRPALHDKNKSRFHRLVRVRRERRVLLFILAERFSGAPMFLEEWISRPMAGCTIMGPIASLHRYPGDGKLKLFWGQFKV